MQGLAVSRTLCGCSSARTGLAKSSLRSAHCRSARHRRSVVRAQQDDEPLSKGGESMESLFLKELQKRGINSSDEGDEAEPARKAKDPFTTTSTQAPPPSSPSSTWDTRDLEDQLARSRQLNSEGIEGLIPRASQLLQLGGSVFLAFLPIIAAISLLTGGIYWLFGERFIHSAPKSAGMPAYMDPDALLNAPTVDPYVTFDSP